MGKYIIIPKKREKQDITFFDRLFKQVEQVGPEGNPSEGQMRERDSLNKGAADKPGFEAVIADTLDVDITRNHRVALMLPFFAGQDSLVIADGEAPKKSVYALDFYNGFLIAADLLSHLGMNLGLDVYDTRNSMSHVRRQMSEIKRNHYDLVVGPLYKRTVEEVARQLQDDMVPVISPLSSTVEVRDHPNLIKCIPSSAGTYCRGG
ncbi:MAG: hypothetical protein U5L96_05830 [Owenweeksia sp.]|nr:hypothetical protein [Owenweeksia sp.]